MPAGAIHDTVNVAPTVLGDAVRPVCRGLSHVPQQSADPADAALACEVVLNALRALM
jgi:hypothetical protein